MEDFVINSMVNPTALTKNSKYIGSIFEDRLMIPFMSIKMGKSVIDAIGDVTHRMNNFNFPVIVFHGKADTIANYEDSRRFVYSKVAPFKQIHLFENGFHELQHDVEKDELLECSMRFIESLPNKLPVGRLNVFPIEIRKKKMTKHYIAIAIIVLLLVIKRAKNISIIGSIMGLFRKSK